MMRMMFAYIKGCGFLMAPTLCQDDTDIVGAYKAPVGILSAYSWAIGHI